MMNKIEQQDDAAFTTLGSDSGNPKHDMSDKLGQDAENYVYWAEQVGVTYASIKQRREDAHRIIEQGEADIEAFQQQIAVIDERLQRNEDTNERCGKRIEKAEEELTRIHVEYEALISHASSAIICLKGDCTKKVDTEEEIVSTEELDPTSTRLRQTATTTSAR